MKNLKALALNGLSDQQMNTINGGIIISDHFLLELHKRNSNLKLSGRKGKDLILNASLAD